ncbi:Dolichyl pyrophosphate Glc1Man9GlcNAc2 alpha-1,3-glucosyltransferase [Erysiphe necator]|nr:Dolichyl pyrophosphate Glc1Man9GlcNAc2 alpha-1,3-glucosyltransferase [Erysiphe necator]
MEKSIPQLKPSITQCAIVATAFKLLLFPAYKSTDFEVHRNWLAITNSLPVYQWYRDNTSQWTLDYPPFFAYFEWFLSHFARIVDPEITKVENLGYDSWQAIYFQRATVIISELVLLLALSFFVQSAPAASQKASHAAAILLLLSPGLLVIDHIHFQYNGFLYGVLLLSLTLARENSTILHSGLVFAVLLCLKHIYLYLAPAYFIYILRKYCLYSDCILRVRITNCFKIGIGLLVIFSIAFGPFAYWGQISQLKSRLFPFSRGLCHSYWAPNFWAIYSVTDRVLISLSPYVGLTVNQTALNSLTRGLVGDTSFAILPEVTPKTTFILTILSQILPLIKLFLNPEWDTFIGAVTFCGYSSFIFGWHVHEKAILLIILPFSLIATKDRRFLNAFRPLAVSGYISLFPLLFTAAEFPIKALYTLFWTMLFLVTYDRVTPPSNNSRVFLLDRLTLLYILFSIPLVIYCNLLHQKIWQGKLQFLPLMLMSSYSAVGVVSSWLGFLVVFFTN